MNVSHSAYHLAVILCICSYLLQEKACLMMAKQGTGLFPRSTGQAVFESTLVYCSVVEHDADRSYSSLTFHFFFFLVWIFISIQVWLVFFYIILLLFLRCRFSFFLLIYSSLILSIQPQIPFPPPTPWPPTFSLLKNHCPIISVQRAAGFPERERMCVHLDGREGREDLGGECGGQTIIRIYCIKNLFAIF